MVFIHVYLIFIDPVLSTMSEDNNSVINILIKQTTFNYNLNQYDTFLSFRDEAKMLLSIVPPVGY